jgi:CRP-like cAMP-binding protein
MAMSTHGADQSIEELSHIVLFADLSRPELREIDRVLEEEFYDAGRRVLRAGIEGPNFYVIVDGEAAVSVDGVEKARLTSGDYFGEASLLLGGPPDRDVVAVTDLRCRVLAGVQFERFMLDHPRIMYRMLQTQTFRIHASDRWQE